MKLDPRAPAEARIDADTYARWRYANLNDREKEAQIDLGMTEQEMLDMFRDEYRSA